MPVRLDVRHDLSMSRNGTAVAGYQPYAIRLKRQVLGALALPRQADPSERVDGITRRDRKYGKDRKSLPVLLMAANPAGSTSCALRIGKVGVNAEPCMRTGVMLMNSPFGPATREICCELNAFIPNFHRAVKYDYEETARWANWSTLHHDAHGMSPLVEMRGVPKTHGACRTILSTTTLGWRDVPCWGQSSWIGGGWCNTRTAEGSRKKPLLWEPCRRRTERTSATH